MAAEAAVADGLKRGMVAWAAAVAALVASPAPAAETESAVFETGRRR